MMDGQTLCASLVFSQSHNLDLSLENNITELLRFKPAGGIRFGTQLTTTIFVLPTRLKLPASLKASSYTCLASVGFEQVVND